MDIEKEVHEVLERCLSPPHTESYNVYMNMGIPNIGEWAFCYRKQCAKNGGLPAIDIQHAYIHPDYRRKGAMTKFIMSVAKWCLAKDGVRVRAVYMTRNMVDNDGELEAFWRGFGSENTIVRDDRKIAYVF